MTAFIQAWLQNALQVAGQYIPLMSWNLFLAFVPLVLSCWLFQMSSEHRTTRWWFGVFVFVLFLPNAPYILTDIIHLIHAIRFTENSVYLITLVLVPQFCIFIGAGLLSYVFCLLNVGAYLRRVNLKSWVPIAELGLHALSAIGIFLGRYMRFNSWDAFSRPSELADRIARYLFEAGPIVIICITFVVLTVIYWLGKMAVLGWLREYPRATSFARPALPPAPTSDFDRV